MGSYPLDDKQILDICKLEIQDSKLQKPNIYNQYLPFSECIEQQGFELFNEIRENLSRTIQLAELQPGLSFWSKKLEKLISLYGFYFTKNDHLKLIRFYLSILSITDLNYSNVETCLDMLYQLLRFVFFLSSKSII
jgi:proteasome activator subunit 4